MSQIKIAIVDDSKIDCAMLKSNIEKSGRFSHVTTFNSGLAIKDCFEEHCFDLIIMDVHMPILNGVDTATILFARGYKGKIICVSHGYSHAALERTKAIGVHGFCNKDWHKISQIIESIMDGGVYFDVDYNKYWFEKSLKENLKIHDIDKRLDLLNVHDKRILFYACLGLSAKQTAEKVHFAKHTIDVYRSNLIKKLEFDNLQQVCIWAIVNEVVSFDAINPSNS